MKKAILVSIAALSLAACAKRQIIDPCAARISELQAQFDQAKTSYNMEIGILKSEIKAKNERLSKFKQVDGQGNLLSNTWKSEPHQAPLTGNEPWMK